MSRAPLSSPTSMRGLSCWADRDRGPMPFIPFLLVDAAPPLPAEVLGRAGLGLPPAPARPPSP